MLVFPIGFFGLYGANLSSKYLVTDDFGNLVRAKIPHDFWISQQSEV